jgi:thioredoxin 1
MNDLQVVVTMATIITGAQFQKEVIETSGSKLVLVEFYADWCGPCRAVGPVLEEIGTELADKVRIVKVNIDSEGELAAQFNVMSIPTMVVFKGGAPVGTNVGALPKSEIAKWINSLS